MRSTQPWPRWWHTTLNPAWYHGHNRQPNGRQPFFEGWYYKLIDASGRHKLAVIPGVFLSDDPHAFIQILDGSTSQACYHRYPLSAFQAAGDSFTVAIGDNLFTADHAQLAIQKPNQSIHGTLAFSNTTPWPVSLMSPGIMGWYAWVPTMECYHGVLSLDHTIHGELSVNGRALDFNNGRGYIEKDWGQSFPSGWIWMQTNHFKTVGTSLTASIAMIPWRQTRFRGFIVGLWHQGTLYRFATYTGAKTTHLAIDDEHVEWVLTGRTAGGQHRLHIRARRADAGVLAGPSTTDMGKRVAESLTAEIAVTLTRLSGASQSLIFQEHGRYAGLEVVNPEEELLAVA